MTVTVYQIKDVTKCDYPFLPWSFAKDKFSMEDYEEVYSYILVSDRGSVIIEDEDVLDKVFEHLNVNRPEDFKGHSLSVSDVVELGDNKYYCDMFGWEKING